MIELENHSSVVIITDTNRKLFLFSGYDEEYPVVQFRGLAHLLGGHSDIKDISPYHTLCRELIEEISVDINQREKFAPEQDLSLLVNEILSISKPYADFLVYSPLDHPLKPNGLRNSLMSCYVSEISEKSFEMARTHLSNGKRMVSEGVMHYATRDQIVSGKKKLAWSSPAILRKFLDVQIPNPLESQAINIGKVRNSMEEYSEFLYTLPAGRANYKL